MRGRVRIIVLGAAPIGNADNNAVRKMKKDLKQMAPA
jgi:hypothetical protein